MAFTDFEKAVNNASEIGLTTTGRVSGRETSRPAWFVRRGEKLYLPPVTGSRSQWYKNLLKNPAIRLPPTEPSTARQAIRSQTPAKWFGS